jgi:hypothetical protein
MPAKTSSVLPLRLKRRSRYGRPQPLTPSKRQDRGGSILPSTLRSGLLAVFHPLKLDVDAVRDAAKELVGDGVDRGGVHQAAFA